MTARERVSAALNHREPDRVPLDLYAVSGMLTDEFYFQLKNHLGIEGDIEPFRSGYTANYIDERILQRFDIDFRRLILRPSRSFSKPRSADGRFFDPWGSLWRSRPGSTTLDEPALKNVGTIEELSSYRWPEPTHFGSTDGMREEAKRLSGETGFAVVLRTPGLRGGFLDLGCMLRGTEQFMVDLALSPDYVHYLMGKLCSIYRATYSMALEAVGDYVQIVETMDDLGAQESLLLSPGAWRNLIKPYHALLNDSIKRDAPHARIWFHSDGAILPLIDDLIEIGIDVLNPVQPGAVGMDPQILKEKYGSHLSFHGGIDHQRALTGTPAMVEAEVRRCLGALAPGGGYIFAPSNHLTSDIPSENLVSLYESANAFGRYPLHGA